MAIVPWKERFDQSINTLLSIARDLFGPGTSLCAMPAAQAVAEHRPDYDLYAHGDDARAVFHPCGVSLCAFVLPALSGAQAAYGMDLLTQKAAPVLQTLLGAHPDLYLSLNETGRDLNCLYALNTGHGAIDQQFLCALLDALDAQALYQCEGGAAILFYAPGAEIGPEALALIRHSPLRFGLCGPYERAASARGSMEKARLAALRALKSQVASFSSYRYDILWAEAGLVTSAHGYAAQDFCHHALEQIARYDLREGTEYTQTLKAYMVSARSLRHAAGVLGIHRNTMAYRVRRIGELFHLDLNDANVSFELLFSFRLMMHLPSIHADPHETAGFVPAVMSRALWAALGGKAYDAPGCRLTLMLIDTGSKTDDARNRLIASLLEKLPQACVAFDDEAVYALCPASDRPETQSDLFAQAFTGVVSKPFHASRLTRQVKLMKRFLLYVRALGAKPGLFLSSAYTSTLFFLFLAPYMDLAPFCSDEVIRVMDYDYEKGSALSSSLYAYLANFLDLKQAALDARLHRNTMEYQMKKVLPMIGGAAFDEKLRFEMMCTYRILSTTGSPSFDL